MVILQQCAPYAEFGYIYSPCGAMANAFAGSSLPVYGIPCRKRNCSLTRLLGVGGSLSLPAYRPLYRILNENVKRTKLVTYY